jgi:hypothetical protein
MTTGAQVTEYREHTRRCQADRAQETDAVFKSEELVIQCVGAVIASDVLVRHEVIAQDTSNPSYEGEGYRDDSNSAWTHHDGFISLIQKGNK